MYKLRLTLSIIKILIALIILTPIIGRSTVTPADNLEKIRRYTRMIEFDYIQWTLDAFYLKYSQSALSLTRYIPAGNQSNLVRQHLDLIRQMEQVKADIERIYADPKITDKASASAGLLQRQRALIEKDRQLAPMAEAVLQQQLSKVLADMNLSLVGQPVPPPLYHVTPLPVALIVSPRNIIRQEANISLLPNLTLDEIVALEQSLESNLNVSALVVNIGGVGVYPTMVMSTTDLSWLTEVIAHEWTHNFLTLRPLGINYDTSHQLRTMNETAATIAGKEIGLEILKLYYPDKVPPPPPPTTPQPRTDRPPSTPQPPAFDFRKEMNITRVTADELLAAGKIDEAEQYMEERRKLFWENGYQIRRLNQAYFAFHGAYADTPGGAAGKDPVGPAVRALRSQSASLSEFLERISWMTSFEQLLRAIDSSQPLTDLH